MANEIVATAHHDEVMRAETVEELLILERFRQEDDAGKARMLKTLQPVD